MDPLEVDWYKVIHRCGQMLVIKPFHPVRGFDKEIRSRTKWPARGTVVGEWLYGKNAGTLTLMVHSPMRR